MFLRPQHFQAQDRYIDSLVAARHGWTQPYSWGFGEITLDEGLAELGQVGIASARGIMPDGTPFSIPGDFAAPPSLIVDPQTRDAIVYLTIPTRQAGMQEFAEKESGSPDARYLVEPARLNDNFSAERTEEEIELGTANLRLGITPNETEGRILLGIRRIREVSGKRLVFDDRYIPPVIDIRASRLRSALSDLIGRQRQMSDELAITAAETAEGGQDAFRAFNLLQTLNRWGPVLDHMAAMPVIHPERMYENLCSLAGEVSTLMREERRPPEFPEYDHENLQATFDPVITLLQVMLSGRIERLATQLELRMLSPGQYMHVNSNPAQLKQSHLFLAVAAERIALEDIQKRFPSIAKVGPNTKMPQLIQSNLPGIPLRYEPTPPSQIRVLQGHVYFEIDRRSKEWDEITQAPALGLFVSDAWPGLKIELWAVKQRS